MMKTLTLLFAIGLLASPAFSQIQNPNWLGSATYEMAIPFGKASDFGGSFAPLGFGIDGRKFIAPHTSVGFATGWQLMDQSSTDPITINNGNTTITGSQHRYINAVPILFGGFYDWDSGGGTRRFIPYIGGSLGTFWEERRVNIGIFGFNETAWHFALAPEVGVAYPMKDVVPFLRVRYNYLFSSEGSGDLHYLNISIGFAYE